MIESTFTWGEVTQASPLRVKLDGDSSAIPATPATLVGYLAVGDRVRCELANNRLLVHGRSGGIPFATDATTITGTATDQTVTPAGLLAAMSAFASRRNAVINGAFRTNQRGVVTGVALANGAYGFDRWRCLGDVNTTLTFTSAPQGQTVTMGFSGAGSTYGLIRQTIERADMEAGTYVLSWLGTATARVFNVGDTPPGFVASPLVVTLDGTADVAVEFITTSGTTVGRVQLELGTTPTQFEVIPIQQELAECMRYFARLKPTVAGSILALGVQDALTTSCATLFMPTAMRAVPTVAYANLYWTDYLNFNAAVSAMSVYGGIPGSNAVSLRVTFASNGAATARGAVTAQSATTSYLDLSADL